MAHVEIKQASLQSNRPDHIAYLTFNRPEVSNAFNGEMMAEIIGHLQQLQTTQDCRALVIRAKGKHFSAGADLAWMKQSASLTYEQNLAEAEKLSSLFSSLSHLPFPTFAVVHGSTFGGALGVVACCDWAVALKNSRFCLSEVKLGLLPAVILPYLCQRMPPGPLRRYALTARVFGAEEAQAAGLIQCIVDETELDAFLKEELNQVLLGSPVAQKIFKREHQKMSGAKDFTREMIQTIADARASENGQEGLQSFLNRSTPSWVLKLPDDFSGGN